VKGRGGELAHERLCLRGGGKRGGGPGSRRPRREKKKAKVTERSTEMSEQKDCGNEKRKVSAGTKREGSFCGGRQKEDRARRKVVRFTEGQRNEGKEKGKSFASRVR